jgi:hypothetical protein
MRKNKIVKNESSKDIVSVDIDNIPDIVAGRIENISKLEEEVKKSENSANDAMKFVNNEMERYKKGLFDIRVGNTKDIIEDIQKAINKLVFAQQTNVNAMKKSFDFQKKLAETSQYLFELGCANITVNRIAVRAIEAKMNGAGEAEISELAKQEMLAVVKQLKAQEDILKKQEFLTAKVKENSSLLKEKDFLDKEQTEKIDSLNKENKKQNKQISDIYNILSEKEQANTEQSQKIQKLEILFKKNDSIDKKYTEEITKIKKKISRKIDIVALILSVCALICSVVNIILNFII